MICSADNHFTRTIHPTPFNGKSRPLTVYRKKTIRICLDTLVFKITFEIRQISPFLSVGSTPSNKLEGRRP